MKLIIFGATGTVGSHLVHQAIEAGHEVTAFGRNPKKLSISSHNFRFIVGDVLNESDVRDAIEGQEAVLCTLGAGRKGVIRSQGTANIIAAMEQRGLKRLICQTTLGCGDSEPNLNFFWRHIMFGWFIKEAFKDHQIQESLVINSGLDWTIVRPSAFTNDTASHNYRIGFGPDVTDLKLKISRADVAHFMINNIQDDTHSLKTVSISN